MKNAIIAAAMLAVCVSDAHHTIHGQEKTPLLVTSNFPGGSVRVTEIDQQTRTIRFTPALHEKRGWTCWWYFKIAGLTPGETIALEVSGDRFALADRASFSTDDRQWRHTAPGERSKDRVVYKLKAEASVMWFAWGPPFVLKHAQELVEGAAKKSPHAKAIELCKSKEGRPVPALVVTEGNAKDRVVIWIHARQHAWEAGSSWVSQGFVEWLISDDPRAEALRRKAIVYIVPIMDVDNVEIGAGGKNQNPHDHNRDWSAAPVWNEVKEATQRIAALAKRKEFDLFIDLHNPAPNDPKSFFFVTPKEELTAVGRNNLETFLEATRAEITGPLAISPKTKESGPRYDKDWQRISGNWVAKNTLPHVVSCCLETAWNTPESNQENYRRVGRELGLAIERYFRADSARRRE